jgi:hypothetical protein
VTPEQFNQYVTIGSAAVQVGLQVAGKIQAMVKLFHPDVTLTEDQINAVEEAIVADALRRKAEREAMGQA